MACNISIDWQKTTGHTIQGVLTEIYIQGTANNCNSIKITLTCGGFALPSATVQVSSTGDWFYYFTPLPTDCTCNGKIKVRAECADDKERCINADHDVQYDLPCIEKPGQVPVCLPPTWNVKKIHNCDFAGNRKLELSVTVSGAPVADIELRDAGTNKAVAPPKQGPTPLTIDYVGDYPNNTNQSFILVYNQPNCPASHFYVSIPTCKSDIIPSAPGWQLDPKTPPEHPPTVPDIPGQEGKTPSGPGGTGSGSGDCGFVWMIGAAMSLAAGAVAVTLAVNLCIPGAAAISWWWAIGPAIGAAFVVGMAYFLCSVMPECRCPNGCDWAQIGTMTAVASAAVVGWLAGCCPVLAWVSAGFLAAFGAALAAWARVCRPTRCTVLLAILAALVSGAVPAIGYIKLVPVLAACGSYIVATAAGLVAATLAAIAGAKCTD